MNIEEETIKYANEVAGHCTCPNNGDASCPWCEIYWDIINDSDNYFSQQLGK